MSVSVRGLTGFCLLLASVAMPHEGALAAASGDARPPRIAYHNEDAFNQIMRENAVFFNMLVSLSYTMAFSDPAWDIGVKNINVNLITREVRDAQGRQIVRVRVAGNVRKNNNVELDLLDGQGALVGKGFFGYESGQLSFYDRNSRAIIQGYVDWSGDFILYDRRLPDGKQDLASGYVDPCFYCGSMPYAWYDGLGTQVGGGRMIPYDYSYDAGHIRLYWTFDRGSVGNGRPAYGEADYILQGEATGAINSALFDLPRTAESFFANPYSLIPEPVGKSLLPRVTNDTGIAVTNPTDRKIGVTYVARHYDGSIVSGEGIENPITYSFNPRLQFAAFPGEIFRGLQGNDRRGIFGPDEVGWVEIFSYDGDVQALFLDGDVTGRALDGNIGAEEGSSPIIFPALRLGDGESTEIELLNLSFDDVVVRLELLDRSGRVLSEERESFLAGYGIRTFFLGPGSGFLSVPDWSAVGVLRATCNNNNSIGSTSCAKLVGLATTKDRFQSAATSFAAGAQDAGRVVLGTHLVAGRSGSGFWQTSVTVTRLEGEAAPVYLDVYDGAGNLLRTLQETVARGGQAVFLLDGSASPWRDEPLTGYARARSDAGAIAGTVAIRWTDGGRSLYSSYPLAAYMFSVFRFNQVAQGHAGTIEYWTGLALLNDLDKRVGVQVEVYRPDGALDRTASLQLGPYQQASGLVSEILDDAGYQRLDGYILVRATEPISAIVLYGDTDSQFLASVPGIPR